MLKFSVYVVRLLCFNCVLFTSLLFEGVSTFLEIDSKIDLKKLTGLLVRALL